MSKILVPFHITDYTGSPGSVQSGFKKFYLKNGYFKLFDGATVSDVVLDRPLDGFVPLIGTITSNDTVLTALEKLQNAITSVVIPTSNLQQVVDVGNAISNYGGIGTATIQSTNFSNNRTLYLNNNNFATIKIEDNLNANHYVIIDIDTINLNGVSYNWSSIVSPPVIGTWGTLNYPTWVSGSPFVKMTAAGTFVLDNTVYYPNNNPLGFITSSALTGYVPYTGATQAVNLGTFSLTANFITTTIDSTINGLTIGKGGGNIASNTVLGNNALFKNTTGYNNSSFGEKSLFNNTEGFSNVAIGYQTLLNNTLGTYNVGIGNIALYANTTGINNTSIGASSLKDNTIGYGNTAVGLQSMFLNTEGFANTAIGVQSLYNVTIGNNNVGLGFNTRTLNPSDTNSIVIGYNAVGLGPQTVVLGNTNILITRLRGAVQGGSFVKDGGTNLEFLMADGSTSIASSPAALTKINDTNVTLTLGGNPLTALLQNVSLTLGWTGTLADGRIASAATWNAKQNALSGTGIVKSTAGVISYINGTTSQYIRGDGTLATFPTIPTVGTWGALNYPTWVSGTPFVKMTAAGTFALDTTVYYPNSNPSGFITSAALSGYVPTSRTLTINGVTYDLSANRSWTIATSSSPLTTKGDLYTFSTADTRLPVGTDGQILVVNSSVPEGLSWQDNYADWTSVVKHIVKNNGLNGTITKGTAVYVTGSDGTNMLVGRASNTTEATSSKTMGLMQSNITTTGGTQTGFVITEGLLSGLNTAGQTAGDPVWLGVNGALIYGLINKPYAPNHLVFIGIVTKVSAGNGEIFVKVQNGFELKEIHDVDLITTTPINGDLLGFNGTLWVNKTIASWLGYTPANASGTTNYVSKFTNTTTLGVSQIYDDGNNIGFGTTTPIAKIHVVGNTGLAFSTNTSNHGMAYIKTVVMDPMTAPYEGDLTFSAPYWDGMLYSFPERIRLAAHTGNLGINTPAPTEKLHVVGNARITGAVYDSNNEPGTSGQVLSSTGIGTDWIDLPASPTNQIQVCSASGSHIAIDSTNLIGNAGIVYNYSINNGIFYETGILTVVWSSDYGASQVVRSGQVTIGLNTEISFSVGTLANSIILYLDSSVPGTGPYNVTLTKNVLLSCGVVPPPVTFNITTESNDSIITENNSFIVTN